jgi:hypothetical protein
MNNSDSSIRNLDSFQVAKAEISRLLESFSLPKSLKTSLFDAYKKVSLITQSKKDLKNPEIMVPLVLFFYARLNDISINVYELIEKSKISKKLFISFVFQILEASDWSRSAQSFLEGEYEKRKFTQFLKFLECYSHCPICKKEHKKEYVIKHYFYQNKTIRRKLITSLETNISIVECKDNNINCIFFYDRKCYIGVLCENCLKK